MYDYDFDPRGRKVKMPRRRGRVPPQLRAWVYRRRRHDPGRKVYGNLSGRGYHFVSRSGRARYDPGPYGRMRRALSWHRFWDWGTGLGTFIYGTTHVDVQTQRANWSKYGFGGMLSDFIARWTGIQVQIGGFKSGLGQSINPGRILNKYTAAAVLMMLYNKYGKGLPGKKYTRLAVAPALGYGLGLIADPNGGGPRLQTPAYNPTIMQKESLYGE